MPYIAGLYTLACQVRPDTTPEVFWAKAVETRESVEIPARHPMPSEDEMKKLVQKALDERMATLKERTKGKDMEKAMAEFHNQMTGKRVGTMSEADFRTWTAARVREVILNETKPRWLRTIVNPVRLIEELNR